MNKLAGALSLICFIFGGMLGYSLAYGKIFQEFKQKKAETFHPQPEKPKTSRSLPAGTASFSQVISEASGQKVLPLDSVCEPVLELSLIHI